MVKLVATCAVLLLVASQVQLEPSKSKNAIARARRMFRQFIPEYISSAPPKILDATFGDVEVTLGAELSTSVTAQPPVIYYPLESGCYFTLIFTNVDYLSASDRSLGPILLYLLVNIDDFTKGNFCTVARYLSPNPRAGSGPHRFLLLLYRQEKIIDAENPSVTQYQFRRLGFPIEDFARNNSLCLEAGTYFVIDNQGCED